ncbi:kynurenine 3-monooxygenase [Stylonychia lemnae]|uniref:Kynurenine 3-monooxygenase n=1 Tax=Stylonychia lemnae TaxID=5949 RepID=A0A078ABE1_STYLE|nr:kynurenine 3-monooxygenase [Stylonychia lemnae]|eukprot:CDW79489.1 kynurenine 3-monooxygenase [Stylonychia lemnae]
MEKKNYYAVIGAGPVGYVLSILLALRGFKVELFEKRPDPLTTSQSGEWRSTNLKIIKRSYPALRRVGVFEEFLNYSIEMFQIKTILQNQDEFEILFRGNLPGSTSYSINRVEIQEILARRIQDFQDNIIVHYNACISNVQIDQQSFDVKYSDGKIETKRGYEMVFGTDGIHSAVQQAFLTKPGFSYSREYNGYGYTELQIPALETQEGSKFRIQQNTFFHWPRNNVDVHMWGLPNFAGDINIGLFMKVTGEHSFEYFKKSGFDVFQKFMFEYFPDSKLLMPNMKDYFDKCNLTRIVTMKCGPWKFGNFQLVGESAHAQNPFGGLGFNASMEECVMIDDLIDKYQCDWNLICDDLYKSRKLTADKMNEFGDQQFTLYKDQLYDEPVQISLILQDYLSRVYSDIFQSSSQFIRFDDKDFLECLKFIPVENQLIDDLVKLIPDILDLAKTSRFDQRVFEIVDKYRNLTELASFKNQKSNIKIDKQNGYAFENLFAKYMSSYKQYTPEI